MNRRQPLTDRISIPSPQNADLQVARFLGNVEAVTLVRWQLTKEPIMPPFYSYHGEVLYLEDGRRIYKYHRDETLKEKAARRREERKQDRRVDTLDKIRTLLTNLRNRDEAGAEWVLRMLAGNDQSP